MPEVLFNRINIFERSQNPDKYKVVNVLKNKTTADINDLTFHKPYGQKGVISIIDLDGFIINGNVLETEAIEKISEKSESLIINSARILIRGEYANKKNNITVFPFFSESFSCHLEDIVTRANPDCNFRANVGLGKLSDCLKGKESLFSKFIFDSLGDGKKVVIGGSSFFDRNRVKKIVDVARDKKVSLDNMFFFDTGRIII